MDEPQVNVSLDTHQRPRNTFTCAIGNLHEARALCTDLAQLGVEAGEIQLLEGPMGEQAFRHEPRGTGWVARLLDSMDRPGGRDSDVIQIYRDALHDGHTVMLIPLGRANWDAVAEKVRARGAWSINFYGRSSLEDV